MCSVPPACTPQQEKCANRVCVTPVGFPEEANTLFTDLPISRHIWLQLFLPGLGPPKFAPSPPHPSADVAALFSA